MQNDLWPLKLLMTVAIYLLVGVLVYLLVESRRFDAYMSLPEMAVFIALWPWCLFYWLLNI